MPGPQKTRTGRSRPAVRTEAETRTRYPWGFGLEVVRRVGEAQLGDLAGERDAFGGGFEERVLEPAVDVDVAGLDVERPRRAGDRLNHLFGPAAGIRETEQPPREQPRASVRERDGDVRALHLDAPLLVIRDPDGGRRGRGWPGASGRSGPRRRRRQGWGGSGGGERRGRRRRRGPRLRRGREEELVGRQDEERQRDGEKQSFFFHYLGNRIQAARMKGMAAQQAAQGEARAPACAVTLDGLRRIDAAARHEPAVAAHEGGEQRPVAVNREEQGPRGGPGSRYSRSTSAWEQATISGLATSTRSTAGDSLRTLRRNASRSSRFARLRRTAPPSFRLTASPRRSRPRSLAAATRRNSGPSIRFPRRKARWNSAGERRRCAGRSRAPSATRARLRSASVPSGGAA